MWHTEKGFEINVESLHLHRVHVIVRLFLLDTLRCHCLDVYVLKLFFNCPKCFFFYFYCFVPQGVLLKFLSYSCLDFNLINQTVVVTDSRLCDCAAPDILITSWKKSCVIHREDSYYAHRYIRRLLYSMCHHGYQIISKIEATHCVSQFSFTQQINFLQLLNPDQFNISFCGIYTKHLKIPGHKLQSCSQSFDLHAPGFKPSRPVIIIPCYYSVF